MFRYIALVAILLPAVFAGDFTPCRSGLPTPTQLSVKGCEGVDRCPVALGTNAEMEVIWRAPRDVESFQPIVAAYALGLWIDYPLTGNVTVGCNNLPEQSCPLSAGEDVVYNFNFAVANGYPRIAVDVELNIQDAIGKMVCVTVPIMVTD